MYLSINFDQNDSNDTNIIQYFIMYGLVLFIKLNTFVAHMFYVWLFSNNKSVPIYIKQNKYFLSLNTHTLMCLLGDLEVQIKIEHND